MTYPFHKGTALCLVAAAMQTACGGSGGHGSAPATQVKLGTSSASASLLNLGGLQFKDLNRNGKLDPYEDWRLSAQARAADLLGQMTLAEKAGAMLHGTMQGTSKVMDAALMTTYVQNFAINTFITRMDADAAVIAAAHNQLQTMGETARLGIPISISTDPRNSFSSTAGQTVAAGSFSKWPENLGLAALRDAAFTRRYGELVRQEYRSVGITIGLSPQADVATEPRWARIVNTFGEDPSTVNTQAQAYVEGFQGGSTGITPTSVIAVVKHWGGYGAQKDGLDSHNWYGRFMTFPSNNLATHLKAFDGAIASGAGGIMPTYSMPFGQVSAEGITLEEVAAAYNKPLLTDLLRGKHNFKGVIVSDWGVLRDCDAICRDGVPGGSPGNNLAYSDHHGTSFGVESLSKQERVAKGINAGLDQFGGVLNTDRQLILDAVSAGQVSEARINESVQRILLQKFQQGLFENPYVDVAAATALFATGGHQAEADAAQRRSQVLLQNTGKLLPLAAGVKKVYVYGMDAAVVAAHGYTVVATPAEADVAIIRTQTPWEYPFPTAILAGLFHEGNLAFADGQPDYEAIKAASAVVPTIVSVYLERPAILTAVTGKATAIVGNFGSSDDAVLDVLSGTARPEGKLPFELPSSMAAVLAQKEDLPFDSAAPLFPFGYGLSY